MRYISPAIDSGREFLKPRFNQYLVVCLLILGGILLVFPVENMLFPQQDPMIPVPGANMTVNYFYTPTCPYCAQQRPILEGLSGELSGVAFAFHDVSTMEGSALFHKMAAEAGMDRSKLGVPTTFAGKLPLVGLQSKEAILDAIDECRERCSVESGFNVTTQQAETSFSEFDLPFIGRTDLMSFSLPVLAVVLGAIDGFNPCAMWVLVYLIALIINLNDRKKIWVIVGSFVLASGILYFLFMSAWLNAFLLLGYVRPITLAIGLVALGGGILSLKDYFTTKGALVCKVGDEESHKKTAKRIEHIIAQPLSFGVVLAIIGLAFVVNSVEFVCSAAIPAVFTQILVLSSLSALEYYGYILLYVFFFMLDDLIIFGLAAFAVSSGIGEKYAKHCKGLGGLIMLILGIMLLFAPGLLR